MGYTRQTALPVAEVVSLAQARNFLRLPPSFTQDDDLITGFIQAAREEGEIRTGRALSQRTFAQVLDSFPYFTDTIQSQLAYPPSYYSLPRYSTTLWNYSQMIKLDFSPLISIQSFNYIDTNGDLQSLAEDVDYIVDRQTEDARIFPIPGQYWPPCLYTPNAVQINFTAGYDPNPAAVDTYVVNVSPPEEQPTSTIVSGVPQMIILAILNLVAYWYNNRGAAGMVPPRIEQIFLNNAVNDWSPSRG
jgi:hypothetical protein